MTGLALREGAPTATEDGERFVVVRIGTQWYAAPVAEVREIVTLPPVTEVPGAGPGVRGVVLLHGAVVTLIDPRATLGEPDDAGDDARARGLAVDFEGERIALRVDEVARILVIPHSCVESAQELPCSPGAYVVGVARSVGAATEGFVVLLDLGALVGAALSNNERFS